VLHVPTPCTSSQAPAALRKAIGQQLIEQAMGRKQHDQQRQQRQQSGAHGVPAHASEPADLAQFGALLEKNRTNALFVLFLCAQV
jgi:hypothetical protein